MLTVANTALVVIDVQGKLARMMHEHERLFDNLRRLIDGAHAMELPIVCTEQLPDKLGATVPEVLAALGNVPRIPKSSFSCCGCDAFTEAVAATGRTHWLVCGIEAHICVYQTCRDLLARGLQVELVTDAVSSRAASNRELALRRLTAAGAAPTSVEMALMELLVTADAPAFREILRIIR